MRGRAFGFAGLAFALSLVASLMPVLTGKVIEPQADGLGYVVIGLKLAKTGTLSGEAYYDPEIEVKPENFFAPLYPYFLSKFVLANNDIDASFLCLNQHRGNAGNCDVDALRTITIIQAVFVALTTTLIFLCAFEIFAAPLPAFLSLVLVLLTGSFAQYGGLMLTETFAFLFFFAALWSGLRLGATEKLIWTFALGLMIGLAALSRPSYLYPAYLTVLAIILWQLWPGRFNIRKAVIHVAALCLAAGLVLIPWMARNVVHLDSFSVTSGYGSFILIQRVAYNMMTMQEWLVAFVYWLPDFGDNLAADLFDPSLYQRLSWDHPESFYRVGQVMRSETIAAAASPDAHMSMVLEQYLWPNLAWHTWVTFPIVFRGMWVGSYLSVAAVLVALPALPYFFAEKRLGALLVLSVPIVFLLGLHGFATVNVGRYNEPLVAIYAIIVVGFGLEVLRFWSRKSVRAASSAYQFLHGRKSNDISTGTVNQL